jgi:hypothetical protein
MKRFLIAALVLSVASMAFGASYTFSNGITISSTFTNDAGPTTRVKLFVLSNGGFGAPIAFTDVTFTLPGGGTIGQMLGDINDTGLGETQDINSSNDSLGAAAAALDQGPPYAYNANKDTHTSAGFSAVLGATTPAANKWFVSSLGQDALPPSFTLGTVTAVQFAQIVVPDGIDLGSGLQMVGSVSCAAVSGGTVTKTTISIPEPITMSMLALGGLAMLRRRR